MPRYQIGDDRFEVGPLDIGLAVGGPQAAKVVDYQVDRLIRAIGRTIDGVQPVLGIRKLP